MISYQNSLCHVCLMLEQCEFTDMISSDRGTEFSRGLPKERTPGFSRVVPSRHIPASTAASVSQRTAYMHSLAPRAMFNLFVYIIAPLNIINRFNVRHRIIAL